MSGNYIVVFKDHVTSAQIQEYVNNVNANGGQVNHRYDSVLKGFSAKLSDAQLRNIQSLQDDAIDYIEPDGTVTTQ